MSTNGNGKVATIRNDGVLINATTGLGTTKDKSEYTTVGFAPQLSQEQQAQLAQDVFIGRICSAKPDAATRRWCDVDLPEDVEPEVLNAFNQYRDTIGGETEDEELISDREIFSWAGYLANVHRGAAIVLDVDDGRPPSEPIDPRRIKTIRSAQVLDSYKIFPDLTQSSNPWGATHYDVMVPQFSGDRLAMMFDRNRLTKTAGGYLYKVHRSRVLRIPGVRIPPDLMLWNQGWDRSLIEQLWDAFKSWMSSYKDAGNLIHDYSLFVYSLSGLRDMVSEGQEDSLRSRFQAFRASISGLGGAAIDKDNESIDFIQRQFGGLPELMDKFRDLLIGASGVPHTVLFGESPSGLGATGESEEKTWADAVEEYQTRVIQPRLRRMYRLIWLAKDGPTNGEEPEGWGIKFLPLRQQTEDERLMGLNSFVNALSAGINGGWLLPEEARASFEGGKAIYEIKLDQDAWQQKQEQENQGFDFGGFGGGLGGEAPPPTEEIPTDATEEPAPAEPPPTGQATLDSIRTDGRVIKWNGLEIGVTHEPGSQRWTGATPMRASYGRIYRSWGQGEDGKAIDAYISPAFDPSTDTNPIYRVAQRHPDTGELDEYKYFFGYATPKDVKQAHVYHVGVERFGSIERVSPETLDLYRKDSTYHADACGCEACSAKEKKTRRKRKKVEPDDEESEFRGDNETPRERGLVPKKITNREGERQTVWVRPPNARKIPVQDIVLRVGESGLSRQMNAGGIPRDKQVQVVRSLTESFAAVSSVHSLDLVPQIPIAFSSKVDPQLMGAYVSKRTQNGLIPARFVVNLGRLQNPDTQEAYIRTIGGSMAHEIGHSVDHRLGGRDFASELGNNERVNAVVDALLKTSAVAKLNEIKETGRSTISANGNSTRVRANPQYAAYLLEKKELFARAYHQYIGLRSNMKPISQALNETAANNPKYPLKWSDEEFEPIAQAFDNLFQRDNDGP